VQSRSAELRLALDGLVDASSLPAKSKPDTIVIAAGFRALLGALLAHGALQLATGRRPNTTSFWLEQVQRRRRGRSLWLTLLSLLEEQAEGLAKPLRALLAPTPLRDLLQRNSLILDDRCLSQVLDCVVTASADDPFAALVTHLEALGSMHELFLDLQLTRHAGKLRVTDHILRRRSGSHFTPSALCRVVAERTLEPLLRGKDSRALLALRICDPAMGTGAFLIHSCDLVACALSAAWKREGKLHKGADDERTLRRARRTVIERCLYGVDKDEQAVSLARASLMLCSYEATGPDLDLSSKLRHADAVVGHPCPIPSKIPSGSQAFHWPVEFPEVFSLEGFDAIVGNPPWVAYVGRAAQPLDAALARYYLANNPAFHGYRTLHGLFVHRAAQLLKPNGRLGLLIPTSVADLDGYAATRVSLDALCTVDEPLPDFGDGRFPGVFQPCIALLAACRSEPVPGSATPWTLLRDDLDPQAESLLQRLATLPPLPAELFGERGFQTTGTDRNFLRRQEGPRGQFTLPMSEGIDVREFVAAAPTVYAAPRALQGRVRPDADWKSVAIWIRQTARYPIAAPAQGTPFRNSILAGFSNGSYSAPFLLCYLNSDVIRWYHFMSRRDARQGMPQLKIGHLRRLPAPQSPRAVRQLHGLGSKLAAQRGPNAVERTKMNAWACDALNLSAAERTLVANWAAKNPLPKSRRT
jgi:hypothetical protein